MSKQSTQDWYDNTEEKIRKEMGEIIKDKDRDSMINKYNILLNKLRYYEEEANRKRNNLLNITNNNNNNKTNKKKTVTRISNEDGHKFFETRNTRSPNTSPTDHVQRKFNIFISFLDNTRTTIEKITGSSNGGSHHRKTKRHTKTKRNTKTKRHSKTKRH
jgi:hypothetical protein